MDIESQVCFLLSTLITLYALAITVSVVSVIIILLEPKFGRSVKYIRK